MSKEQGIGNNSLINSLLVNRISETPTQQVEEVEMPVLEEQEMPKVPEEEQTEPAPVDYTEYEEEPTEVSLPDEPEVETSEATNSSEASPERLRRRRQVTAKWGVKLYDKLQGLGAMLAYDRLNTPQEYIAQRNRLLEKVYKGSINDKEREELKQVNVIVDSFLKRRTTFHESVHMSEDLVQDINELVEDLLEVSGKDINPVWILVGLMLIQPVINLVSVFSEKLQYNTKL